MRRARFSDRSHAPNSARTEDAETGGNFSSLGPVAGTVDVLGGVIGPSGSHIVSVSKTTAASAATHRAV